VNNKAIFITVRSASTRLPTKALIEIDGMKTIEYVIRQAKKSKLADLIVLCTTLQQEDDALCEIAKKNGIKCFRGSVTDKLERWRGAAKSYDVDFFVTADGDDLFCSAELIDLAFEQQLRNKSEFIESDEVVCGSFTYGISVNALTKACEIKQTDDTEMMWVYFTNTDICTVEKLENVPTLYKRKDVRMTLDYKEDLEFFSNVIKHFDRKDFTTRDVLKYLDKNESIKDINFFLEETWRENQINKTNLVIK
tara:strand:- start:7171 stop:7923 length:753 start_codon:yes stop_codon:yes gene_type:complete